jgi:hypothetical protein
MDIPMFGSDLFAIEAQSEAEASPDHESTGELEAEFEELARRLENLRRHLK